MKPRREPPKPPQRRKDDTETTQRLPHLAAALKALEKAEQATAADRAKYPYSPKDYR